jgi:hypothetical protein
MPTKYWVEYFSNACAWEHYGEFFTKAEAIAYIRSSYESEDEYQRGKRDWRIIVSITF